MASPRNFDDFVIEDSEAGPTLVCSVCDGWEHAEDLSLTDLIDIVKAHKHTNRTHTYPGTD